MTNEVNIKGLDKAKLLAALFNNSRQQGLGFLDPSGWGDITEEEASEEIKKSRRMYFDYLRGRVMKVDLLGDTMFTGLYNRDNGSGAAEKVINDLFDQLNSNKTDEV